MIDVEALFSGLMKTRWGPRANRSMQHTGHVPVKFSYNTCAYESLVFLFDATNTKHTTSAVVCAYLQLCHAAHDERGS